MPEKTGIRPRKRAVDGSRKVADTGTIPGNMGVWEVRLIAGILIECRGARKARLYSPLAVFRIIRNDFPIQSKFGFFERKEGVQSWQSRTVRRRNSGWR